MAKLNIGYEGQAIWDWHANELHQQHRRNHGILQIFRESEGFVNATATSSQPDCPFGPQHPKETSKLISSLKHYLPSEPQQTLQPSFNSKSEPLPQENRIENVIGFGICTHVLHLPIPSNMDLISSVQMITYYFGHLQFRAAKTTRLTGWSVVV